MYTSDHIASYSCYTYAYVCIHIYIYMCMCIYRERELGRACYMNLCLLYVVIYIIYNIILSIYLSMNLSYVCLCVQYLGAWGFKWDSCWAQLHGACSTSLVAKACPSLSIASISINDDIILYSFLYIYICTYIIIYIEREIRVIHIYIYTHMCV